MLAISYEINWKGETNNTSIHRARAVDPDGLRNQIRSSREAIRGGSAGGREA